MGAQSDDHADALLATVISCVRDGAVSLRTDHQDMLHDILASLDVCSRSYAIAYARCAQD